MKISEQNKELFQALTIARAKIVQPKKDKANPYFGSKYVPLEAVVDCVENALESTGLSFLQDIENNELSTVIFHENGQWASLGAVELKPTKNDPQQLGSAITYARRYSLSTVFGITSEEDDDANSASGYNKAPTQKKQQTKPKTQPKQPQKKMYKKSWLLEQINLGTMTSDHANELYKNGQVIDDMKGQA